MGRNIYALCIVFVQNIKMKGSTLKRDLWQYDEIINLWKLLVESFLIFFAVIIIVICCHGLVKLFVNYVIISDYYYAGMYRPIVQIATLRVKYYIGSRTHARLHHCSTNKDRYWVCFAEHKNHHFLNQYLWIQVMIKVYSKQRAGWLLSSQRRKFHSARNAVICLIPNDFFVQSFKWCTIYSVTHHKMCNNGSYHCLFERLGGYSD